ncbi:MAG: pyruvate formate lyase family protein [Planctomycetota bacterium]
MSRHSQTQNIPDVAVLKDLREFFAAGYFEKPDVSPVIRWSRAVRRRFENRTPTPYDGGLLYPCGRRLPAPLTEDRCLQPSYSFTWQVNGEALNQAVEGAKDAQQREALQALRDALRVETERVNVAHTPHTIGGWGYTHSIPNYGRILREGLDAHALRIERGLSDAEGNGEDGVDFYDGLRDVVKGVRAWHENLLAHLRSWFSDDAEQCRNRERLVGALSRVPFQPARSFFEAMVAYNFIYYLDDCDNPGRMDQELQPFYENNDEISREEAAALIAAFADNVCANGGWSAAIGGTRPDGQSGYNDVTRLMIEAAHGRYRPSLELRVRPDMPDDVWEAALDAVATGSGNPAFYNEELFLNGLLDADLGLTKSDATWWNGGGCTETMVHGMSNVGSIEAGINLPLVFEKTLRERLPKATSFDDFVQGFKADVAATVAEIVDCVNRNQEAKARWRPQPMRSLLIDDCIDQGIDYNAGGARYNWSVVNVAGLSNITDSLAAIREVVFDKKEKSPDELIGILDRNFEGDEPFRRRLMQCPRFGNDRPEVDGIAADLAGFIFREFLRYRPWRGGKFLPSCIMFVTYGRVGADIGAMPDGRLASEPVADSIGPVQGRDKSGPTAMFKSVTRLPLHLALGTPILNARFAKALFQNEESRAQLRHLIETYFKMGGMQLQISVVSKEDMLAAQKNPEQYQDLIVRIGGYSEYFTRLDRALQESVIARTEHEV